MTERPNWDSVRTRSWTKWLLPVIGLWIVTGWLIVPFIIRSAFDGGLFGFLGGLMAGRDVHTVGVYTGHWAALAAKVLFGLVAAWIAGLVLMQPLAGHMVRSVYHLVPTFSERFQRRTVALVLALVSVTILMQVFIVPGEWETARGHEYERITRSLVAGEGFSFPPTLRWLYEDGAPGDSEYGATAWKEPIYPVFMATAFSMFGPHYGRLAVVLVQLGFLIVTCVLIYLLGSRLFGPGVGVVAALATILRPDLHYVHSAKMQVPGISGLFLVGGLMLLLRYAESPSARRAAWLGVFLGVGALAHAVLLVLVPLAGLFIFLHSGGRAGRMTLKPALLMCLAALLTISPWTTRNYVRFGHVIPVQTGFGLFANVSNPFLAETYQTDIDACGDGSPPVFRADGLLDATATFLADERTINSVHRRAVACVAARGGEAYDDLNEHERDGLHREQLAGFVREHPVEFARLTATKGSMFIFDFPVRGRGNTPLAVLGIAGMVLLARRPRMWIFPVAMLAYAAPFAIGAPLYFRYQAPLAPLHALFAVAIAVVLLTRPFRAVRRVWDRMGER